MKFKCANETIGLGGSITGRITEQDTGAPVVDQMVQVQQATRAMCKTDENGMYRIMAIPGETSVYASPTGIYTSADYSSRYFYADSYQELFEKGEAQKQLSKEFVREWLMDNGFQGKDGQQVPEMTDEIVTGISERYIELFENIVGEKFVKADSSEVAARIEKNVTAYLANR